MDRVQEAVKGLEQLASVSVRGWWRRDRNCTWSKIWNMLDMYLGKLDSVISAGPDEIHPRLPWELAEVFVEPLAIMQIR